MAGSGSRRYRPSTAWSCASSSASTCRSAASADSASLPWSPLAGGFLSGKFDKNQPPPTGTRLEKLKERLASFDNERNWRILAAVRAVAAELSTTPSAVSLAWLLAKREVSSVIFGARSIEQLEDNAKASDLALPENAVKQLDEASAFELGYPYGFMQSVQGRW